MAHMIQTLNKSCIDLLLDQWCIDQIRPNALRRTLTWDQSIGDGYDSPSPVVWFAYVA